MAKPYITQMYDRLDKICERRYGIYDSKTHQHVWDANPGLVSHGMLLPMGMALKLPPLPTPNTDTTPVIDQIRLWD
jgi:phage tail protein X